MPDPTPPSPAQRPTGQVDLDVEAIRARHVPKPDGGFGRFCDWCEVEWPCEKVLLIAALDDARRLADLTAEQENANAQIIVEERGLRRAAESLLADLDAAREALRRAEKERDAARADLAIMDADARAAFAAIVPGWDSPDALLAEFDRTAAHARAYRELSASWQARAETAEAALGVERRLHMETINAKERQVARAQEAEIRAMEAEAERDRMRPVVEAAREWFASCYDPVRSLSGEHDLAAAVDTYETQEGTDG